MEGVGEEAGSGQADTLWVSSEERKLSCFHGCIQTNTKGICNTAQGSLVHPAMGTTLTAQNTAMEGPLKQTL